MNNSSIYMFPLVHACCMLGVHTSILTVGSPVPTGAVTVTMGTKSPILTSWSTGLRNVCPCNIKHQINSNASMLLKMLCMYALCMDDDGCAYLHTDSRTPSSHWDIHSNCRQMYHCMSLHSDRLGYRSLRLQSDNATYVM